MKTGGNKMVRSGAIVAVAGLAGVLPAAAQDSRIFLTTSAAVVMPGESAMISAMARFPGSGHAFASAEFDVNGSMPGWSLLSGGVAVLDDVLGIAASQAHNPFGGPVADPSNPIRVWNGLFTPASYQPRLATFEPVIGSFSYYPSPLTASSVPSVADGVRTSVLINPIQVGQAQAAPGNGTQMEPVGDGIIAAPEGADPAILIGLLLPAVQKVREAASLPPSGLNLTQVFEPVADPVPMEEISLNFGKIEFDMYEIGQSFCGSGGGQICWYSNGQLICAILCLTSAPAPTIDRLPDATTSYVVVDPVLGTTSLVMSLEFDVPATLVVPGHHAASVERVEVRRVLPGVRSMRPGVRTSEFEDAGMVKLSVVATCPADLTGTAMPNQFGYGLPDGVLNNDDFFYYLAQFSIGNLGVADLTGSAIQGQPGYGVPDGILNNDDFFYYLALYAAGC